MKKIFAGVATMKDRQYALSKVIEAISPQVERLTIYCDYEYTPIYDNYYPNAVFIKRGDNPTLGDAGKFAGLALLEKEEREDSVYITIDDDLIYPPDFASRLTNALDLYDRKAVVGFHGWNAKPNQRSYHRDRMEVFHLRAPLANDTYAHVIGSGATAFYVPTLAGLGLSYFQRPNMADLWLSLFCNERNIPRVVLAHDPDYIPLSPYVDHNKETIWAWNANNPEKERFQTELLNSANWNYGKTV